MTATETVNAMQPGGANTADLLKLAAIIDALAKRVDKWRATAAYLNAEPATPLPDELSDREHDELLDSESRKKYGAAGIVVPGGSERT